MYKITNHFFIFLLIWGLSSCGGGETSEPNSDFGGDSFSRDVENTDLNRPYKDMDNDQLDLSNNEDTSLDVAVDSSPDMPEDLGPRPENAPKIPKSFIDLYGDIVNHQNTDPSNFTPERLTIVDGKVLDDQGVPIAGVKVSAPDFPDIGHVLTNVDGDFSFALNGGGVVTLRYTKMGFIDSERRVQSLWNEFVHIGSIVLKEYSQTVTTVNFSNASQIQVARGDVETDYAGERQATLLVNSDTNASLRLKDGTLVNMPSLNLRFTEFTVGVAGPSAMPGSLPGPSAYTYAVEISADEAVAMNAASVEFDKPVYFYVDDFIGFPVGTVVPIGYYDREKHAWIPSDNGKVISIVSVINGKAAVDIDGDGIADTGTVLTDLGFTDDELTKLASLYTVGKVLWRAAITHFTPFDCNWPYGPPPGAKGPKKFRDPPDKNCDEKGSIIECESGVLRESINLPGTPFSISYSSYDAHFEPAYQIPVPILSESIPASLDCALITVDIAGRRLYHGLDKEEVHKVGADEIFNVQWDGRDHLGNLLQGAQEYKVTLNYLYKAHYYANNDALRRSFGVTSTRGGGSGGGGSAASNITRWQDPNAPPKTFTGERCSGELIGISTFSKGYLGRYVRGQDLGGWTVDAHHAYDFGAQTVHLGNGHRYSQKSSALRKVAGNGVEGTPTDGGDSLTQPIRAQMFAVKPDGTIITDDSFSFNQSRMGLLNYFEHRPDGSVHKSQNLVSPDTGGGLAYKVIRIASDDSIFFMGYLGGAISKIRSIFREFGSGPLKKIVHPLEGAVRISENYQGPVENLNLGVLRDFVISKDGVIYVASFDDDGFSNPVIWKVNQDGFVSKYLGANDSFSDQNLTLNSFVSSSISFGLNLYIDSKDRLIISLGVSRTVFRFEEDGDVTLLAGGGGQGTSNYENGNLATDVFMYPLGLDRDDRLYFRGNSGRIYYVDQDGRIRHHVRGRGNPSSTGNTDYLEKSTEEAVFPYSRIMFGPTNELHILGGVANYIFKVLSDITVLSRDGSLTFLFDEKGQHLETRETLTGNLVYRFEYDRFDRLVSIIDIDGLKTSVERDQIGDPKAIVGPYGVRTALVLDDDSRIKSVSNANNETLNITYKTNGLIQELVDPKGQRKAYRFDVEGRFTGESDAEGSRKTLTQSRTANFRSGSLSSEMGRTVTHTIDTEGEENSIVRKSIDSAGFETITSILAGKNRTIKYPDGRMVTLSMRNSSYGRGSHDYIDKLVTVYPSGKSIEISATQESEAFPNATTDGLLSLTSTMSIDRQILTNEYDGLTKTNTTTSPMGRTSFSRLDDKGRVVESGMAGLLPTSMEYDGDGRLIKITQGTRSSSFGYDAKSNVNQITDAMNRSVDFGFDAVGRMVSQTLPDGRTHNFAFDPNGNISSIQPAGRDPHTFDYNAVDQATEYNPPVLQSVLNASTSQAYNLDHQPTKTTLSDGREINIDYDQAGRLSTVSGPLGVYTSNYSITTGQLERIDGLNAGSVSFEYDGDLITKLTNVQDEISSTVDWTYDNALRIRTQNLSGNYTSYRYDRDSNLLEAGELRLTRDAATGFVTNTQLRNVLSTVVINGYGELENEHFTYNGSDLFEVQQTFNNMGQITDRTETIEGVSKNYAYTYDDNDRLTEVFEDGNLVEDFTFDANDNVTERKVNGSTIIATFDEQDRLISRGTQLYRYNDHGQLNEIADSVTGDLTNLDYDVFGSLRQVSMPDGTIVDYIIDATGRRVGKRINGTFDKGWVYAGGLRPSAEVNNVGTVTSLFVYGSGITPAYMVKGSITYRFVTDHLGSVRQVVNASTGVIEQNIIYDVFGKKIVDTNPGFQPFGYAGGLHDTDTGFIQFSARDYDPETGRWMAKDPSGFAGESSNLYTYANADPINLIDPTGNFAIIPILLVLDKVADVSAFSYSAYKIYRDNIAGDCDNLGSNIVGLALDGAGFFLPIAGLGVAWRSGKFAKKFKKLTCSFTEDTPVTMCDGTKQPIETLQEGDLVLSKNEQTGDVSCETVRSPYVNPNRVIYELTTRNENGETSVIETTDNHPFYVDGRGWTRVDELQNSDLLEGRDSILEVIEIVETNRVEDVYNFGVDGNHSYFVGEDGAWVHNCIFDLVRDVNGLPKNARLLGGPASHSQAGKAWERLTKFLEKNVGLDKNTASNRLHKLKESNGLGAADNAVFDMTGNMFHPKTGEHIGQLTDKTLGN